MRSMWLRRLTIPQSILPIHRFKLMKTPLIDKENSSPKPWL
jgi:hypothetical protein